MATTVFGRDQASSVRAGQNLLERLLSTADSVPLLLVRLGLGIVILPHGLQKLLGMFGGFGISGTLGFFSSLGIPNWLGFLAIVAESFGALGLILGFLTRVSAFGIFCVMMGAAIMVHAPYGFFINWSGQQAGNGFEFHLLAALAALSLVLGGGGRYSFDRNLWRKLRGSVATGSW